LPRLPLRSRPPGRLRSGGPREVPECPSLHDLRCSIYRSTDQACGRDKAAVAPFRTAKGRGMKARPASIRCPSGSTAATSWRAWGRHGGRGAPGKIGAFRRGSRLSRFKHATFVSWSSPRALRPHRLGAGDQGDDRSQARDPRVRAGGDRKTQGSWRCRRRSRRGPRPMMRIVGPMARHLEVPGRPWTSRSRTRTRPGLLRCAGRVMHTPGHTNGSVSVLLESGERSSAISR